MLVLGIESTCDETACAIVRDGKEILANVVTSQIDLHKEFGGVVPELACRRHIDVLIPVIREALKQAATTLDAIDLIAVAHGPGLIGALLLGLNSAQSLSLALNIPFIGVNHIAAHLYAAMMSYTKPIQFPCLGVVLSGGHSSIMHIHEIGKYDVIAETVDDAIGEAFDKVAKILGLSYPGGPIIEKLAQNGDPTRYSLKAGTVKGHPLAFSFSGLKTGVLYAAKGQNGNGKTLPEADHPDIAASFQHTAFTDIIKKTLKAAEKHGCQQILFGGGVTNNQHLRAMFSEASPNYDFIWPSAGLSLDNAAMIAGLGYHQYKLQKSGDPMDLEAKVRF